MTDAIDPRVTAIRLDKIVGRGSCSYIDECYSDEELSAALDQAQLSRRAVTEAVRWARRGHAVWVDVMDDRIADAKNSQW